MSEDFAALLSKTTPLDDAKSRSVRALSAEESGLWRQIVKDVKPLVYEAPINLSPPPASRFEAPLSPSARLTAGPSAPIFSQKPDLSLGCSIHLDKSTAKKFKTGRMQIEARLDLHGLTQQQAHKALHEFMYVSWDLGRRCVLVITGKGVKRQGVLREALASWLNNPALRPLILSFSHAQIKDGGDGAFYVLLKKRRDIVLR